MKYSVHVWFNQLHNKEEIIIFGFYVWTSGLAFNCGLHSGSSEILSLHFQINNLDVFLTFIGDDTSMMWNKTG